MTPGGTATSPPITVVDRHTPEIISSSPTAPNPGNTVTVTGTGLLGATIQLRANAPPMGITPLDVIASTETSLMFTMPSVAPGDYFVIAGELPFPPGCGFGRTIGDLIVLP